MSDQGQNESRRTGGDAGPARARAATLVLVAITALTLFVCFALARPFVPALTWALTLAVVARPLYDRVARRLNNRPNLSAALVVIIVVLLVAAPGVLMGRYLVNQAGQGLQALKAQTESEKWRSTLESNPQLAQVVGRLEPVLDVRGGAERLANALGPYLTSLVGGSLWVLAQLVITFFTFFYFLRDRREIMKKVRSLLPLSQSEADRLFSRVGDTVYATVYGSFVVALLQGILGGLMFWWLGLPAPLLWGSAMALLSLIPALGAPVVWLPAVIFLALTGAWVKAVILAGWGVVVIGSVDNLLYPVLVGDRLRMHSLLIFFAVLGGLWLFGAAGLVLGPVAVTAADVLLEVWRERAGGARETEGGFEG
ncbi:MAG TPA: AI-2E family transporter [Pyrinomonadaceae bacterium]|nr:AI-2E family transporter [Pyrinomonadaceae bacterium]